MHLPIPMSIPSKTMIIHKSTQGELLLAFNSLKTGGHAFAHLVFGQHPKKSQTQVRPSPANRQVTIKCSSHHKTRVLHVVVRVARSLSLLSDCSNRNSTSAQRGKRVDVSAITKPTGYRHCKADLQPDPEYPKITGSHCM